MGFFDIFKRGRVEQNAAVSGNAETNQNQGGWATQDVYARSVFYSGCAYNIADIRDFMRNPMVNIKQLRELSRWAYSTNGVISTAIDYLKSLYTLDGVIVAKRGVKSAKKDYDKNRAKAQAALNTIRYKEMIRDAIFKDARDGMYAAYLEIAESPRERRVSLTDWEVGQIVELSAFDMNAAVIPLPIEYVRIIGRRNNSYVIAFDLRYFDGFADDEVRERKLKGFPREIQNGWKNYSENKLNGEWLILDNHKTIVTKIKSEINDPYGLPFAIAALDDAAYAQYFIDTKRGVLDGVNNQIIYQTYPEGKTKGTSALSSQQQQDQHNLIKNALNTHNQNGSGIAFFSLASGTKLDRIPIDLSLLDEKNENAIKEDINKDIGFSAAALDGSASGNYATANLNLELVAANVYGWIADIVEELNKVLNKNIIRDTSCRIELYILPVTLVNRDKMVGYMSDLYARGKGSLTAWIAATGMSPDNYIALMEYEREQDFENRFPVHKTSFTISRDAANSDKNNGGRPSEDTDNPANVQNRTNGGNVAPKPSG